MTPVRVVSQLDRVVRALQRVRATRVAAESLAAACVALLTALIVRLAFGHAYTSWIWLPAFVAGGAVAWWRVRLQNLTRLTRVDAALWAESKVSVLQYSLVTLAEQVDVQNSDRVQQRLASYASLTDWPTSVAHALRHVQTRALLMLLAALLTLGAAAYPWNVQRDLVGAGGVRPTLGGATAAGADGRLQVTVSLIPPAYAGQPVRTVAFGETIAALVGSVIRVDGAGAVPDSALRVQESTDSAIGIARGVRVSATNDGWRATVQVGSAPLALRLRDTRGERWLLVTPVVDSIPIVSLTLPDADTLVMDTTAKLRVTGTARDDIALRDARIEYIVSSGGGERYTFTSGVLDARRGALGRSVAVSAVLDFAALKLTPGDLVHVRITARDNNALSGPSMGSSDTRTIRIPRADERDSVAVEQLPPSPVDTSVISQRQLLLQTERLVTRMRSISRETMLAESQRIGGSQARLRKQVSDIVFARLGDNPSGEHAHYAGDGHDHGRGELPATSVLEAASRATGGLNSMLDSDGDETPVVALNRPLLEAYNAMWDATRALQGGTPREALDPMRRALAAIQRARAAERVYLRGTPPAALVDIEKIRLTGTDSAKFETRRALNALPAADRRIAERVLRVLASFARRDASSLDSLRLVRLDALASAPTLAAALGDAIADVEVGRDVTQRLLRVRRLALQPWNRSDGSRLWTGGAP
jgi:hypothetical protein